MPVKRAAVIEMAKNWCGLIDANLRDWGIPTEVLSGLMAKTGALDALDAKPHPERTPVFYAEIRMAGKALAAAMRDVKRRYFFAPPLSDADIAALGLKPRDRSPAPVAAPVSPAAGELAFPAKGIVRVVKIRPAAPERDKRASYGVRIYYGILGGGHAGGCAGGSFRLRSAPATGDDLPHSVFTATRSHTFDLTAERGNRLFVCMRYENKKGQRGPWGDVLETFIP
jgi:hypothetical protein